MDGGPVPSPFDALVAAAREGAPWALTRLYEELAPAVAGYLRSQGAAEPDDLTSEVFVGVLRGLRRFDGSWEQCRSWVFTIAHRRLVDARRRAGRRPVAELADDDVPPDPREVADEALARVGTERVRALCARLTADQRDVLLLRLVGDLTVEQVAAVVGKGSGAVKALQRRGLQSLRALLEPEGVPL